MNYYIITGASRGIGEAIARKVMADNNHLFCISRSLNQDLVDTAGKKGVVLDYIAYDLQHAEGIEPLMAGIFAKIDGAKAESLYLINNAGVLDPIKPLEKCESEALITNVHVNLLAPMLLTSSFIKLSGEFHVEKRVINISSGAGKHPYFGWSAYCSTKAGLDMLTKCVAVEQQNKEYPVKILSLAPGVVDTDMQSLIRSAKAEDFPQLQRFIALKNEGQLRSPDFVADKVVELLAAPDFP